VCSSNSAARRSNQTLYEALSERLAAFVPLTTGTGSFDSRASRKREAHFAQDDRCWVRLTSTINVFSCGVSQNALRVTASVAPTRTTTVAFALWQSVAAHQRRISSRLFHKVCHPERSNCRAKRSSYGVEGAHARMRQHRHCKAFS
jgi:hypothetical protein